MLTFQANYLNSASIQRINAYKPCTKKVAFVEINPHSTSDILAIHKTAINWDKNGGEGLAYDICHSVNKKTKDRFFAITTQKTGFEQLDYRQILSLAQVKTKNKNEEFIEYLQVDPENKKKAENPNFSHIGTAMLDSIKQLFYKKHIELDSLKTAIPFYLRNGFIDIGSAGGTERRMRWEASL